MRTATHRHWRTRHGKRCLCGDKPPKNPAPDGSPLCDRCLQVALDRGYSVQYTPSPSLSTFTVPGNGDKPDLNVSVDSIFLMKVPDPRDKGA